MIEKGKYGRVDGSPRFNVLEHLKKGELVLGATLNIPDASVVEIMALAGFDYVWIDNEHNLYSRDELRAFIRAADACGLASMVRTADIYSIAGLVDFGVSGLMIPQIRNAAQARDIVDRVKYIPNGRRGFCNTGRAHRYGEMSMKDYMKECETQPFLMLQIEDMEGYRNMEEICAMPGVDIICPGPGDLSQALGKIGQWDDEELAKVKNDIFACALRHGKEGMIPCDPTKVWDLVGQGVRMLAIGDDKVYLLNAFKEKVNLVRNWKK